LKEQIKQELENILNARIPIWGSLSWLYKEKEKDDSLSSFSYLAGSVKSLEQPILSPLDTPIFTVPVGAITFTTGGINVCLFDLMRLILLLLKTWKENFVNSSKNTVACILIY